jgi:hypothetical protein
MTPITERLAEALRLIRYTLPDTEVCCGWIQGGGMDENGNGEPPSCCGQPINPREVVNEALAAYDAQRAEVADVAFVVTNEKINDLQIETIQNMIKRCKQAHFANIVCKVRINGKWEEYEADWIKHLELAEAPSPPQEDRT